MTYAAILNGRYMSIITYLVILKVFHTHGLNGWLSEVGNLNLYQLKISWTHKMFGEFDKTAMHPLKHML